LYCGAVILKMGTIVQHSGAIKTKPVSIVELYGGVEPKVAAVKTSK
jgi:hypothetical protein